MGGTEVDVTGDRLAQLSKRLARTGAPRSSGQIDVLARGLVRPMDRRKALGLMGAGVAAMVMPSLLAPAPARGAKPCLTGCADPSVCGQGCVGCGEERTLENGCKTCAKNGCTGPKELNCDANCCRLLDKFTGVTLYYTCPWSEPGCAARLEPDGYFVKKCVCRGAACGTQCCKFGQMCSPFSRTCVPECKSPKKQFACTNREGCCGYGYRCTQDGCECESGSTCGLRCCPDGARCLGSTCSTPLEPTPRFKRLLNGLKDFFGGAQQAAASTGGGAATRSTFARAHIAANSPTAVQHALATLSAVNAYRGVAIDAFLRHDSRFVALKPKSSLPKLAAGDGLGPKSADALNKLVAAELKASAQIYAAGAALADSVSALEVASKSPVLRSLQTKQAMRAARSAAAHAGAAAKVLAGVPALRSKAVAAMRAERVAEVFVSADLMQTSTAINRAGRLPPEVQTLLGKLGLDTTRIAAEFAAARPAAGGVLLEPLASATTNRQIKSLSGELAKYAKAGRTGKLRTVKGRPLKVSGSAG